MNCMYKASEKKSGCRGMCAICFFFGTGAVETSRKLTPLQNHGILIHEETRADPNEVSPWRLKNIFCFSGEGIGIICDNRRRNSKSECPGAGYGGKPIYIWVNYNDLTRISLEIIVSKGKHPQIALIQVSEIL